MNLISIIKNKFKTKIKMGMENLNVEQKVQREQVEKNNFLREVIWGRDFTFYESYGVGTLLFKKSDEDNLKRKALLRFRVH